VAKPYEPTVREAETLANFEKRKAKQIPAPCVKVTMSEDEIGKTNARIEVNHQDPETDYRLLPEALGTSDRDFLNGTLKSLSLAAQAGATIDQDNMNYALDASWHSAERFGRGHGRRSDGCDSPHHDECRCASQWLKDARNVGRA
jgi:hypothetical protein